jgi:hypothetical protein
LPQHSFLIIALKWKNKDEFYAADMFSFYFLHVSSFSFSLALREMGSTGFPTALMSGLRAGFLENWKLSNKLPSGLR